MQLPRQARAPQDNNETQQRKDVMYIVGYTYKADIYCAECIVEAMIRQGELSPAARDMGAERALDQCASANALDRYDEQSFDSYEFPKVIFDSTDTEHCGACFEILA